MSESLVGSPGGVLAVLCAVAAFWFFVDKQCGWKFFQCVPPLAGHLARMAAGQ